MTLQGGAKGTTKLKGSGAKLFAINDRAFLRSIGLRSGDPVSVIELLKSLSDKPEEQYEILMRTAGYTQLSRKLAQKEREKQELEQSQDQERSPEEVEQAQNEAIRRFSDREMLLTEGTETQWALSVSQIDVLQKAGVIEVAQLGELPKTKEAVVDVAVMHMDTVREKFMILFKAFADLNENINKYITFPKRDAAIKAGERAISDTSVIQREIQDNVQADESAVEDDLD